MLITLFGPGPCVLKSSGTEKPETYTLIQFFDYFLYPSFCLSPFHVLLALYIFYSFLILSHPLTHSLSFIFFILFSPTGHSPCFSLPMHVFHIFSLSQRSPGATRKHHENPTPISFTLIGSSLPMSSNWQKIPNPSLYFIRFSLNQTL